ncbi:putative oxidoreductase [Podospora australis]|uniref:Oxidoreductase n=1 Tax=Podospora australis TaxID=1536484 RepID=A0AAN6WK37_9PEZI|nr:putative oxidoreductase [Podospora australis]
MSAFSFNKPIYLGLELALKALKEGDSVIAAVRTPSNVPSSLLVPAVKVLPFDLSLSQPELDSYATSAFAAFGRVDVLVNNAGYAYMGAIEETEDSLVQKQFDINVFGILRTIRAFLPGLRARGSGFIMNLSSIGGLHGYPSNGVYCATKFALEGITEALAAEIAPFGLKAVIVEPGYFRTAFLTGATSGGSDNIAPENPAYAGTVAHEARAAFWAYNGKQPGNPVEGAARMWEYIAGEGLFKGKERLLRLPLGSDRGALMKQFAKELADTAEVYEEVWRSTDFRK